MTYTIVGIQLNFTNNTKPNWITPAIQKNYPQSFTKFRTDFQTTLSLKNTKTTLDKILTSVNASKKVDKRLQFKFITFNKVETKKILLLLLEQALTLFRQEGVIMKF